MKANKKTAIIFMLIVVAFGSTPLCAMQNLKPGSQKKTSSVWKKLTKKGKEPAQKFYCLVSSCDFSSCVKDLVKEHESREHDFVMPKKKFKCTFASCSFASEFEDSIKEHVEAHYRWCNQEMIELFNRYWEATHYHQVGLKSKEPLSQELSRVEDIVSFVFDDVMSQILPSTWEVASDESLPIVSEALQEVIFSGIDQDVINEACSRYKQQVDLLVKEDLLEKPKAQEILENIETLYECFSDSLWREEYNKVLSQGIAQLSLQVYKDAAMHCVEK